MSHLTESDGLAARAQRHADLRRRAAARLTGVAATKGAAARAADALTVLHALASSPATAADALTLLHELQVHQVEVDLQSEALHETNAELESALRRQTELYDAQPVGCFCVDALRVVHGLNQTGAEMLGVATGDARGMPLDAFLGVDSARRLASAMSSLGPDRRRVSCRLTLCARKGPVRAVLASVARDLAEGRFLLSLADVGDVDAGPGS